AVLASRPVRRVRRPAASSVAMLGLAMAARALLEPVPSVPRATLAAAPRLASATLGRPSALVSVALLVMHLRVLLTLPQVLRRVWVTGAVVEVAKSKAVAEVATEVVAEVEQLLLLPALVLP